MCVSVCVGDSVRVYIHSKHDTHDTNAARPCCVCVRACVKVCVCVYVCEYVYVKKCMCRKVCVCT